MGGGTEFRVSTTISPATVCRPCVEVAQCNSPLELGTPGQGGLGLLCPRYVQERPAVTGARAKPVALRAVEWRGGSGLSSRTCRCCRRRCKPLAWPRVRGKRSQDEAPDPRKGPPGLIAFDLSPYLIHGVDSVYETIETQECTKPLSMRDTAEKTVSAQGMMAKGFPDRIPGLPQQRRTTLPLPRVDATTLPSYGGIPVASPPTQVSGWQWSTKRPDHPERL